MYKTVFCSPAYMISPLDDLCRYGIIKDGRTRLVFKDGEHVFGIRYIKKCDARVFYSREDGPSMFGFPLNAENILFSIDGAFYGSTILFCEQAQMEDENKLMWVLQYGDKLPTTCQEYYGKSFKDLLLEDI